MRKYLENLEARLSDDQKDILSHIYKPTVVTTPLQDARRDLCILPDGEIRSYGDLYASRHFATDGKKAYLSSVDCGLSWSIKYSKGKMNSCTYIDEGDIYLSSVDTYSSGFGCDGLWVLRSKIGPDDPDPEVIKLSDEKFGDTFLPVKSEFSNRVWFTTQQSNDTRTATFFYSDDFGLTWNRRELPDLPQHRVVYPHKGLRWSVFNGTEPYAVELSEKKMLMLLRNSTDSFYQSFSYDGGDSWTAPEPSIFYGVNTTPFLLRLSDGRILAFWNNTKPLPQPNYDTLKPHPGNAVVEGRGENAFTNRDAAHVAISDDGGETWKGFREVLLNPVRNSSDFRYFGGAKYSADKSVHQFQAYELPMGKILLSLGQNIASRRILIFDLNWLTESDRQENFLEGLINLTTHTYLKSVPGCSMENVGNGHCAYNRTYSAVPLPDPDGGFGEVLSIKKLTDDRTYNAIGGAGWNFPMSKRGTVSVNLKISEGDITLTLTDRWYNVCDPFVAELSPFSFKLEKDDIPEGFNTLDIDFDTLSGMATVRLGEKVLFSLRMKTPCPTGISYLIVQCSADGDGAYIKKLEKRDGIMKFIPYTDPSFRFTGVWQENENGEIVSYKLSAMAEVGFTGNRIDILCRGGGEGIRWFIDDKPVTAKTTVSGYRFDTEPGKHSLKFIVRLGDRIYLSGVKIGESENLFTTKERPYIHFIGDSITEAKRSYAFQCVEDLDADYCIIAKGGMAVCDGFGWYMQPTKPYGDPDRLGMETMYWKLADMGYIEDIGDYNFKYCRTPNIISVFLGTNDYLDKPADEEAGNIEKFKVHYAAFIEKLRAKFPGVPILILQALSDKYCRVRGIDAAFELMKEKVDNVYLVDSNNWGIEISEDGTHPTQAGYDDFGAKLAAYMKKFL